MVRPADAAAGDDRVLVPRSVYSALWTIQLVAAFAICINHLSFALIEDLKLSDFWAGQPTLWGIAYVAFSTGFVTQTHQISPDRDPTFVAFAIRRFLRIAIPSYCAIAVDYFLFSHRSLGSQTTSWWPWLSVATLTQTWTYNVYGAGSLPLPLGPSNLVWIGSCLLALFLVHGATSRLLNALGRRGALVLLISSALMCTVFFEVLNAYQVSLSQWSVDHYGQRMAPYRFEIWLRLYNPFSEGVHYFAGAALAQWLVRSKLKFERSDWITVGALVIALATATASPFPRYLGLDIGLVCLVFAIGDARVDPKPEPKGTSRCRAVTLSDLTTLNYAIIIFHIMFYAPFTGLRIKATGLPLIFFDVIKVLLVNLAMIAVLLVINRLLIAPVIRRCEAVLGIQPSIDLHL